MSKNETLIAVADDDAHFQGLISDSLSLADLEPSPMFLFAKTENELIDAVHMRDVDLITLDINFSSSETWHRQGLDVLPRLVQIKPRVPIIVVSGQLTMKRIRDDMLGIAPVRGFVEKGTATFDDDLAEMAKKAIEWGQAQRQQADAIFEQGLAAARDGRPIDAARLLVDAYRTGDLSGAHKREFREQLHDLLPAIEHLPDLLGDAYLALLEHSFQLNDEIHVIYYAQQMIELFPQKEKVAREYLILAAELGDKIYAMIDQRLALIARYRAEGNHQGVIGECQAIRQVLANVVDSYEREAEALRALGRYDEAVATNFDLVDIWVRNGEPLKAKEVLKAIAVLDPEARYRHAIEKWEQDITTIGEQLQKLDHLAPYPCLLLCSAPACREEAGASGSYFRVVEAMLPGKCDVCGDAYTQALSALKNKVISIVGGRFGPRYIEAITKLGAREVLHHEGTDEVHKIPGLISKADGVLVVIAYASHAGTIKAETEAARQGKPIGRVRFYGANQVARGLVLDLLPKML